jgi:hypothetical protein
LKINHLATLVGLLNEDPRYYLEADQLHLCNLKKVEWMRILRLEVENELKQFQKWQPATKLRAITMVNTNTW